MRVLQIWLLPIGKIHHYGAKGPGLVVMGDDSCSRGCGFECWMDMTFFTLICYKNCIACSKRPKINKKEAGLANFLKRFITIATTTEMQKCWFRPNFSFSAVWQIMLTTFKLALIDWHWLRCSKIREREREKKVAYLLLLLLLPLSDAKSALINSSKLSTKLKGKG